MITHTFTSLDGNRYDVDDTGAVHHVNPQRFVYDETYVSIYDTPAYQRGNDILQALRFGFCCGAHGEPIQSILDYGYGNGAFLRSLDSSRFERYGVDITGTKLEGVDTMVSLEEMKGMPVDVMTFWDSIEHVQDWDFVRFLCAQTLVISLPFCHYDVTGLGQAWFDTKYPHRKPNEHLHHHNDVSLALTMHRLGWRRVGLSNHEDMVRKSRYENHLPNILSMAFKRI